MIEFENAALLTDVFGHWPSFHDAEIRAVRLASPRSRTASLELDIDVAEMSGEIDAEGYYGTRARCLVTFRFDDVVGASLADFGLQNVLEDIEVTALSDEDRARVGGFWPGRRYGVRCVPIPGFCEIEFTCESAAVVAVRPVTASEGADSNEAAT